jgi:hypothetical protein
MWREGLNPDLIAWLANILALVFGAGLGLRGLIDPHWAARLVRLQPDQQGGGFAEFRATYGGVFFGLHAAALAFSAAWVWNGALPIGLCALGASTALAAGWFGAAFGRALAMWRDRAMTPFNVKSALVEALACALIAAPWATWGLSAAG